MQKFYVVGIGPGSTLQMTPMALAKMATVDVIAGYSLYVQQLKEMFPNKEFLQTGMTGEVERCRLALEQAMAGREVAMVSSGDAGIYGMAGLVLEMAKDLPLEVVVLPGVTAASSGAALLGAPLMHDFAVISLSDRLTPWERIARRLQAAAAADFCLVLYNPRSHSRPDLLGRARQLIMEAKEGEPAAVGATPVGIVKNVSREGEQTIITTLAEMDEEQVDMFSTVFIGNSQTYIQNTAVGERIITPRGYMTSQGGK